jgi:hypothetical protein
MEIEGPADIDPSQIKVKFLYGDFWKIIAARRVNELLGRSQPKLNIWYGDLTRLTDKIQPRTYSKSW